MTGLVDSRPAVRAVIVVTLVTGLGLALAGTADGDDDEEARSLRDGIYTEAQAARGKAAYREKCIECHKEDLRGDQLMTPSLVGIGFTFRWKDKKLYDYFVGMRDTMPQSEPASLSEETYVDLLAYLLSEIGYPAGDRELSADPAALKEIVITSDL